VGVAKKLGMIAIVQDHASFVYYSVLNVVGLLLPNGSSFYITEAGS
jgi:hypothetical protein